MKAPADWGQIGLGSTVLAEDKDEGGFFPAKVMSTKLPDSFVLVWAGYPDLPEFSRARVELALLNPEVVEGVA